MKSTKKLFLFIAVIMALSTTSAQSIIDANGDTIATINAMGVILDSENLPYGEINSTGDVKNAIGETIGHIDGNTFKDLVGTTKGRIDASGNIYDLNDAQIGLIQFDLMVIDANNHLIGRSSAPMDAKKLAAFFFFYFNN